MAAKLARIVFVILSVVVVLSLVLAAVGVFTVRRSFPQVDGQVQAPGLDGTVEIFRDAYGIPQIYATTPHDLFFAQGYVHAQDRFWQMDFWRHVGSGRLAEMFGDSQVSTDQFLRTLGWARVAQQELEQIDPNSREVLEDYAQGVNAYLADHQGSALSLEYAVLKLLAPKYKPEPWQPINSMTWAKAMAWDLGGNMDSEISRVEMLKTLSADQVSQIFAPYPSDAPVIVPQPNPSAQVQAPAGQTAQTQDAGWASALQDPGALESLGQVARSAGQLEALLGPVGAGIGSNSWALAGSRTATGKPFLANDPHLGVQMPSIWYEVGLHCVQKSDACPYEVAGYSFAGAPGVIIGHNDRIAWGFTNVGPDVEDLYIEQINPDNPNQYMYQGQWQDMTVVSETIRTSGGETLPLMVRYTRHGPIISDTYEPLKDFGQKAAVDLPPKYAITLRWTALDPTHTFTSIWKFNRAQNWDEFRQAAATFDVPSQNLLYADVDGNIGYQTPGKIPIRSAGNGTLPVPGWTGEYEWTGFIPFEKLPYAFNPPQGYIVTANNAVVGPDYPYLLTTEWDYGYRARRIVEMIESAPGPVDIPYIQQMQGDDKDLNAAALVPVLLQTPLADDRLEQIGSILQNWDYQDRMDSAPAALFAAFWRRLLADTFQDDLPKADWPGGGDQYFTVVQNLIAQPDSPWWDNRTTPQKETRPDIFRQAFGEAVSDLESLLGKDPARWRWGDLHTVTFRNATLGESGIAPIEALFNRGPFPAAGGASIVNATSWDASLPDPRQAFMVDWLPSMRMIVDLSNLPASQAVNTTGQSGHAYHPHYIDLADLWRNIRYHPMLWDRAQVEGAAKSHLTLKP